MLVKEDGSAMRVHTRAQETGDGEWDAWAKWPGRNSDRKYGHFDISFEYCAIFILTQSILAEGGGDLRS